MHNAYVLLLVLANFPHNSQIESCYLLEMLDSFKVMANSIILWSLIYNSEFTNIHISDA